MAKKAKQYLTADTYDHTADRCYEDCPGEFQTIQGDAYTIKELFARHQNMSFPNNVAKEGFYGDVEDFAMPDLSKLGGMDIFDRTALYEEIEMRARIAQKQIEDYHKDEATKAAEKAAEIEAVEAAEKKQQSETKADKPAAE